MEEASTRTPLHEPLARRLLRVLRLSARDERIPVVQPLRPAVAAALGRPRELPLPLHRRPAGLDRGQEHALADRRHSPAADPVRLRHRGAACTRAARCGDLPHDLLPACARAPRCGHARLRLHPQSRHRAREPDPRAPRDPGPAVVPGSSVVEAVAHAARDLGDRQHHDHLPRSGARRSAPPVRVRGARRRRGAAAVALGDVADDQPGDPVRRRPRRHPGPAVLHAGVRRRRRRGGSGVAGGRRHVREPRLSARLDARLSRAAVPARLQRLPDGLRVGDGDAPAGGVVRRDTRDRRPVAALGPSGWSNQVSAAATSSVPLVRRRAPAAVRRKRFLLAVANHSVLIGVSIVFLAPFVFIALTALMSDSQALSPNLWPHPFRWQNFIDVFTKAPLWRWTLNTLEYSVLAPLGVVVSGVPVASALALFRFRGRELLFYIVLIALMLPPQVTVVPLYVMWSKFQPFGYHFVGTLWPVIAPNWLGDAFSIFLLRQFFLTIPEEYLDAARVDGCGEVRILSTVVVRLAKPAIVAVALFSFLYTFNDFFLPLLYAGEAPHHWVLSIGLSEFRSLHQVQWNLTMAATLLVMAPVIVIFFLAQKAFVEGVTLTGVKG